jgi:hypothetical protein
MRHLNVSALLISALFLASAAPAGDVHPVLRAPGFQFDEVDSICVMPVIDTKPNPNGRMDTVAARTMVMLAMEERGYRVDSPTCAGSSSRDASKPDGSRWLFTVTFDGLWTKGYIGAVGSFVTASLFDAKTGTEVWRDKAETGGGARLENAVKNRYGLNGWTWTKGMSKNGHEAAPEALFKSAIGPVFLTIDKVGKPSPPLPTTTWPPASFQANIFNTGHGKICPGTVKFTPSEVSFTPNGEGGKCEKYRFQAKRADLEAFGRGLVGSGIPAAFHLVLSGIGTVHFCNADAEQVNLLFAALGSGR